jgi:hypothetical protein
MIQEGDIEIWGKQGEEYSIERKENFAIIKGINKRIKYDFRNHIPMPEDFVPNPFVRYEYRSEVIVTNEKHFLYYLQKMGYRRL